MTTRCAGSFGSLERIIDRHRQQLLIPETDLEGWWTSLDVSEKDVTPLYADHDTSEQFHSEFKTDMDIERLPSGKQAVTRYWANRASMLLNPGTLYAKMN